MINKKQKGYTSLELIRVVVMIVCLFGWGLNIKKFISSDFDESYKEEIIRGIGIPVAPVGIIVGFMTIGYEK